MSRCVTRFISQCQVSLHLDSIYFHCLYRIFFTFRRNLYSQLVSPVAKPLKKVAGERIAGVNRRRGCVVLCLCISSPVTRLIVRIERSRRRNGATETDGKREHDREREGEREREYGARMCKTPVATYNCAWKYFQSLDRCA